MRNIESNRMLPESVLSQQGQSKEKKTKKNVGTKKPSDNKRVSVKRNAIIFPFLCRMLM